MDTALQIAGGIIGFLSAQWGQTGLVVGYLVVYGIPAVSILIEVAEFIVGLTPSKQDDEIVNKVQAVWQKVMPWLEALPHVNLPLSATANLILKYVVKGLDAAKGAIQGWKSKE